MQCEIYVLIIIIATSEILLMMVVKVENTICLFSAGIHKREALFMITMSLRVFLRFWMVNFKKQNMKCPKRESSSRWRKVLFTSEIHWPIWTVRKHASFMLEVLCQWVHGLITLVDFLKLGLGLYMLNIQLSIMQLVMPLHVDSWDPSWCMKFN